jgi:hypothetical protein
MKKSIVSDTRKKRTGRPRVGSEPIMVRMPPPDLEKLDHWISKQSEDLSRPAAIRRLIALGMRAKGK